MTDEVRDMIGKALDNEPPLGIDYATVHAAGRRRLARRHVGIVGGAALAVVAAAGAAVAVGQLNAGPANGPAVPPPATSTTSAPPPEKGCAIPPYTGGFTTQADGVPTAAELAESARLTEAFARFVMPLPPGVSTDPAKVRLCAINESWGTEFPLRHPDGERAVFLEVLPRAGQAPSECGTRREEKCEITQRPDGSVIRISETSAAGPDQPVLVNVLAWRTDDTIVRVLETGTTGPQPKARILDDQALIAIASAPELKINWPAPPLPPRAAEPSDRRAAELTTILAKAQVLPPAGMRQVQVPYARADAMAFYVSQGGYKLDADLVDADGEGNLFINLNPPAPNTPKPDCGGQAGCELIRLADGRTATLTRSQDGDIKTLQLTTVAADGTQLTIMSRNTSARSEWQSKNSGTTRATRSLPPLSAEDLIRIASTVELRW